MRKVVMVGDKQLALESNAFTVILFKKQFNKDFFGELFKLAKLFKGKQEINPENMSDEQIKKFDTNIFNELFWTFAFTADKNVPNFMDFFQEYSELNTIDIMNDVLELIQHSMVTQKKPVVTQQAMNHLQ